MRKKRVTQDAQLLLQLDRLRKETEMRKARLWWLDQFWPKNAGDYLKIEMAHGTKESKWLRQVATYWGMAANRHPLRFQSKLLAGVLRLQDHFLHVPHEIRILGLLA